MLSLKSASLTSRKNGCHKTILMNNLFLIILMIFGLFLIWSGFMMFLKPLKVKGIIAQAGSTFFINYVELSIRLIIGLAFVLFKSKHEFFFTIIGYFLIVSAIILMLVPIKKHNKFSVFASEKLKPIYLRFCAPMAVLFGVLLIYSLYY